MCKFYKLLYLIPIKRIKSFVIQKHFNNCPKCQKTGEIDSYLKNVLLTPEKVEKEQSLWPLIKQKLTAQEELVLKKKWKLKWQWAFAILLIFVITIILIGYMSGLIFQKSPKYNQRITFPLEIRIKVESAKIKNKPAKVYIFQQKNNKITIIWIEPYKNTGG
ncbi:hypothetical protein NLC29_00345 [Candidatus Aminicenantes bacterium AH-873-B07]|nr:hypothetical protein [Candidatus Aminicenantes bacterium AH-873-B07]